MSKIRPDEVSLSLGCVPLTGFASGDHFEYPERVSYRAEDVPKPDVNDPKLWESIKADVDRLFLAKTSMIDECLRSAQSLCGCSIDELKRRVQIVQVAGEGLTVVVLDGIPHPFAFGVFAGLRGYDYAVELVALDDAWPEWRDAECFDRSKLA